MGDKSPKSTHKAAAQKDAKTTSDKAKKTAAAEVIAAAKAPKK